MASSRRASAGGMLGRLGASWRHLESEQRTAGAAAVALFVTMFLPWYTRSAVGVVKDKPVKVDDTLTAFGSFSFVEAAVLLVAIGIIWMLFARGEGKAFHLPFGDGNVIFAAGLWVCLLVFYRQFDKPAPSTTQGLATSVGVSWGIFVTFIVGLFMAFSGQRLRVAHVKEPPLPEDVAPSDVDRAARRRRRADPEPEDDAYDRRDDEDVPAPPAYGDGRPRPRPDAAGTVVDRRGPTVDETLVTDVPEWPPPGATGPTRVVPREPRQPEPPRSDPSEDATRVDPDGQLRFDD